MDAAATAIHHRDIMDIRRGAVVLNQTADGAITVAYAGPDIGKAQDIYRAATGPGVWAFHQSHRAITKRHPEAAAKPAPKPVAIKPAPESPPVAKRLSR